ncbi:hypothetical protein C0995_003070 [Termitomyces sp. Mi166|nr:hypothetical protein C0995_003070 [Termitomyces sp. Mi166\
MRPLKSLLLPLYLFYGSAVIQGAAVLNNITDAFIEKVLSDWGSPGGVGIAVVRRDGQDNWTVETKGYGVATANGSQVTEKTLFAIGSNSKLFTSIATGLLINNESISPRLSWDSKLASVISGWALEDSIATKQASIIDLMSHRTGVPRHDFSYKWSDSVPSVIKKLKFQRLSTEFRDVWQYNNNMYTALSYLPTALLPSKIPFARYVKQHILDPLGLSSTTYSYDVAKTGHLADGFTRQNINFSVNPFVGTSKTFPYWSTIGGEDGNILSGAGGVVSNAVDMATWLQMLLLNGVKPGTDTQIVGTDVIQRVATGITVVNSVAPFPELSPSIYGGGQTVSTYRGHEVIEHDGGVPGFTSLVTRLPFDNLGFAVLSNDQDYGLLLMNVIRYQQLVTSAVPPPPAFPRPPNATLPSVPLTSLSGIYDDGGYGESELCYVSSVYPTESESCRELNAYLSVILPGAVEPGVPTFIIRWDSPWASHLKLSHFNENQFNISALLSVVSLFFPVLWLPMLMQGVAQPNKDQESEPFWTYSSQSPGVNAEFVVNGSHIGLAFTGIWGAGAGVSDPQGPTVRDRAEVWFDKV